MNLRGFAVTASMAALAFSLAITGYADEGGEWSHGGPRASERQPETGPEIAACDAGRAQSPADLMQILAAKPERVETFWQVVQPEIANNGHSIQANVPAGSYTTFNGLRYDLLQMHFHHGRERALEGEQLPMEAHFVHKSTGGELLVLGTFLAPGATKGVLKTILDAASESEGTRTVEAEVDLASLLPEDGAIFRFVSSHTTPPCSTIASWVIRDRPSDASPPPESFGSYYRKNARPTESINRRFILYGF